MRKRKEKQTTEVAFLKNITNKEHSIFIENLYRDNYTIFYRTAYAILKNDADAKDAVNDSFLIIYKYIERIFNLECPVIVPYCINIVKTVSYKMKKKQSKVLFLDYSEALIDKTEFSEGADIMLEKIQENENLYELLTVLSRLEYEILQLRVIEQLKYKEIAQIIGVSEEAAKKRYQRIIKKLRQEQGRCK